MKSTQMSIVLCAALVVACSTELAPDAGGTDAGRHDGGPVDAGLVVALDAGPGAGDAANGSLDAGAADANTVAVDAGPTSVDAGRVDAGPTSVDAGRVDAGPAPSLDAGAAPGDAGPPPCSGEPDGTDCNPAGRRRICLRGACVPSVCGDGFVDPAGGETCDDSGGGDGDGCDGDCHEELAWACAGSPSVCVLQTTGVTQRACGPAPLGYVAPAPLPGGASCDFDVDCASSYCLPAGSSTARCAELATSSASCDDPDETAAVHFVCPGQYAIYCHQPVVPVACPGGDCAMGDGCTRNEDCASGYCYMPTAAATVGICTTQCIEDGSCSWDATLDGCRTPVGTSIDPDPVCVDPH